MLGQQRAGAYVACRLHCRLAHWLPRRVAERFNETEFEARVRTFLAYLPADAANGVNFALDQFRFVHGTSADRSRLTVNALTTHGPTTAGEQESLAGVALGTPVCIVGVAWVLLRGMEGAPRARYWP